PPDPMDLPTGCTFHPRCPVALEECASLDVGLCRSHHAGAAPPSQLSWYGGAAVAVRRNADAATLVRPAAPARDHTPNGGA
ncbi:ABC transporter ATP-binding protein, partial [Nonomuraea sp. NPDC050680]